MVVRNGQLENVEAMTRVLVVDDHPLFREALHSAIDAAYPNVETVDAVDAATALEVLNGSDAFDLVLLDLNMPETRGFEGLLQIRGKFPRLPVVIVSGYDDTRIITESLSYGAAGFIPKSSRRAELVHAIQSVMGGAVYVPPGYSPEQETPEDNRRKEIVHRLATLTPQQLRVLKMLREGLLNKQIAYEMQVGETTVKAHVSEILRKLHVYSRTQAVIEMSKVDLPEFMASDAQALRTDETGRS